MLQRIQTECFSLAVATDGLGCLCQPLPASHQSRAEERQGGAYSSAVGGRRPSRQPLSGNWQLSLGPLPLSPQVIAQHLALPCLAI